MPKKFASWFAPACFAFLLFAAAGGASAQVSNCTVDPDTNQCVVTGSDPDPTGPHAVVGGPVSSSSGGSGGLGSAPYAVLNEDEQSSDDFYTFLLMFWGLA